MNEDWQFYAQNLQELHWISADRVAEKLVVCENVHTLLPGP